MEKSFRTLAYLVFIAFLSHFCMQVNAKNKKADLVLHTREGNIDVSDFKIYSINCLVKENDLTSGEVVAPAPPVVKSPIYLCQNSSAVPLTATAATGASLIWYGTAATGGTGSSVAPTPSTATTGQTKYYVSQSDATGESTRAEIAVNVVADNGGAILSFRCDPTQIAAADKNSSVFFDWTNTPGLPNQYSYSYTVNGGTAVTGTTGPSNLQVFGLSAGQSVTLTLWHTTYPCDRSVLTCSVPCGSTSTTPVFNSVPTSYCINEPTSDLPTSSDDSPPITGTWSPAKVNTATAGTFNYVFTPDPVLFPCAVAKTLTVKVGPVEPNFVDLSICSGQPSPILNTTSPNGITGTWSPSSVDNSTSGSYVFTPNLGQACSPTNKTINVTVNPSDAITKLDWTVTEAFEKNQIVTVTNPVGVNYMYRLDNGPLQESPEFDNVSLGTHSVTVIDKNGCSSFTENNVLVIDYPRFFTPNGDSYNDKWNIYSLKDVLGSKIHIFDRYGKLLKEISPAGPGWDGTYNGEPMPGSDYWFVVDYTEESIPKIFKSHFSLKR